MNLSKMAILSATLLVTLLGSASTVAEQIPVIENIGDEGFSDPASAGTTTAFYSDAQLKKFVLAQKHIATLREEYEQRIENTDATDADASTEDILEEANIRMASIIEEQGLDVETYNEMATAYNSEPRVRNRIDALMP